MVRAFLVSRMRLLIRKVVDIVLAMVVSAEEEIGKIITARGLINPGELGNVLMPERLKFAGYLP